MINDYNPALMLAWKANVDVQFLSPDTMDILNYITSYTTKHESSKENADLRKRLASFKTTNDLFQLFVGMKFNLNKYIFSRVYCFTFVGMLRKRECGLLELVDYIMGHSLHEFDTQHVFINTNAVDQRTRFLLPKKDLTANIMEPFMRNWVDHYYAGRHT